jgi:hypothetical protein
VPETAPCVAVNSFGFLTPFPRIFIAALSAIAAARPVPALHLGEKIV